MPLERIVNVLITTTVASLIAEVAVTIILGPLWWLWALWGALLLLAVAVGVGARRSG